MAWNDSKEERIKFLNEYLDQFKTSQDYKYIKKYNTGIEELVR